jgi:hypothetical protein
VEEITLDAGERMLVHLRVEVPEDTGRTSQVEFLARATSSSSEVDEVKLSLDVAMPDLRILSITYDPHMVEAGGTCRIQVVVDNEGTYAAEDVVLVLLENGEEVGREVVTTMNPDGTATVTVYWSPSAGKKTLTYSVSNSLPELEYEDNSVVHQRTVGGPPDDDDRLVWAGILVAAALVIILLMLQASYSKRIHRGP